MSMKCVICARKADKKGRIGEVYVCGRKNCQLGALFLATHYGRAWPEHVGELAEDEDNSAKISGLMAAGKGDK